LFFNEERIDQGAFLDAFRHGDFFFLTLFGHWLVNNVYQFCVNHHYGF